jgi:hypothetical protein
MHAIKTAIQETSAATARIRLWIVRLLMHTTLPISIREYHEHRQRRLC